MNKKNIERLIGEWQIENSAELAYEQFKALRDKINKLYENRRKANAKSD